MSTLPGASTIGKPRENRTSACASVSGMYLEALRVPKSLA